MDCKVNYHIFCLLFVMSSHACWAQQDAQVSQYMFNNIYLTPAAAGVEGVTRFTALHRSQWQGYQSSFDDGGAPTTQLLTFTAPIFKLNSGFGAYVINDISGPLNTLEVQGMFAYHLGLKDSKLSAGLKLGMYSQTIDYDLYRAINPDDPKLQDKTGKDSQIKPDVSLGLFYRSEKYYAGVGFNHITQAQFDFGVSDSRGKLETHANLTAGYFYDVNFDLQINPSILVKTDFNEYSFDLALIATLRNTMWGGLAFRQSEAVNLILGYSFLKDKSLKLGYSIDFVIKDREAKENFSHEVMLSYELPVGVGGGKKVVRTPRYRH